MTTNRADDDPRSPLRERALADARREAGRDASFTVEDMIKTNPGFSSDEEIDEFIRTVREWRNADIAWADPC